MLKLSQDIAVIHLERCVVGHDLPPLDTVQYKVFVIILPRLILVRAYFHKEILKLFFLFFGGRVFYLEMNV